MSRSRAYSTGSLPSDEHFTHEEQERRLAELIAWFNVTCPDNSCKVPKHPPLLKTTLSSSPTLYDWDTMYSNYRTAFIENNYLCFEKSVIDKACKDKHNKLFDANFKVEIFLHRVDEEFHAAALEDEADGGGDDDEDEDEDD